jgi:glutaryl-CoA dehydrogenase
MDFLSISAMLTEEELTVRDDVRAFVGERIKPRVSRWWEDAHFPREIAPEMGAMGLLGMHLNGYGCAGKSAVSYGLASMELEAGDSGLRTFVSVQGSLAMSAIHKFGAEEQKEEWLPRMAKG